MNCVQLLGHFTEEGYAVDGCSLLKRSLTIEDRNAFNVPFRTMALRQKSHEETLSKMGYNSITMHHCEFMKLLKEPGTELNLFAKSFKRQFYKAWIPRHAMRGGRVEVNSVFDN